jgi:hypothetical protein
VEVKTLTAFAAGSIVLALVLPFALCLVTLVHRPVPRLRAWRACAGVSGVQRPRRRRAPLSNIIPFRLNHNTVAFVDIGVHVGPSRSNNDHIGNLGVLSTVLTSGQCLTIRDLVVHR